MSTPDMFAVLTTIAPPTNCVKKLLAKLIYSADGCLIVIGDSKGPSAYDLPGTVFLPLVEQERIGFKLAENLPTGHYARKNIGYLYAMREGAECIYETDDDNAPLPNWTPRQELLEDVQICHDGADSWVNVYQYFTGKSIWPRGFPLDEIHGELLAARSSFAARRSSLNSAAPRAKNQEPGTPGALRAPIQQGLVNGSPDVDAVWRLTQDRPFEFEDAPSVLLRPGYWCPFNTQSTWWWPVAYPLLYIPSYCSFRMCDIWKSFVAQRCLWELDLGIVFHAPEVFQQRNEHDLMKDFTDEIPGYQRNKELASILSDINLKSGEEHVSDNLLSCYESLVKHEFFPRKELELVQAWLNDVTSQC